MHVPVKTKGINGYMQRIRLSMHECVRMRECTPATRPLMASLWHVAAVGQIKRTPVAIALTEGGLLYSTPVCGAGGLRGDSIHNH